MEPIKSIPNRLKSKVGFRVVQDPVVSELLSIALSEMILPLEIYNVNIDSELRGGC